MLDDLTDLVAGLGAVHVVGVSFGALSALTLAYKRPELVRSLVLSDTTLGRAMLAATEHAAWVAMRYRLADDLQSQARVRAGEIAGPDAPVDVIDEIATNMRRARPAGYKWVTDVIASTDARPWLAAIAVPTLVVCGENDGVVGFALSREIASAIPGARFEMIAGAGHQPNVEAPDVFAAAVGGFIDDDGKGFYKWRRSERKR